MVNEITNMFYNAKKEKETEKKDALKKLKKNQKEERDKLTQNNPSKSKIIICILYSFVLFGFLALYYFDIVNETIMFIVLFVAGLAIIVLGDWFLYEDRKNTKGIFDKNNEDLDILKEMLNSKEANLYSKEKIEFLIKVYNLHINEYKDTVDRNDRNNKEFINSLILPILACSCGIFIASIKESNTILAITICLYAIGFLFIFKAISEAIKELIVRCSGDTLNKSINIRDLLMDLLLRDFISKESNKTKKGW